jgi:F0F1-type ATP synthase membrane subunit b/b'
MFIPRWFQMFLATCCIIGSMLLFFGFNNSTTVKLREIDASLGLIKRPKTSLVFNSMKYMFKPIKGHAGFPVSILIDTPRLIAQALEQILNYFIQKLINSIISKITDFFNGLLDRISNFIGSVAGLRDNISTAQSAIALKAAQVSECLVQGTEGLVADLFKDISPNKNEFAAEIAVDPLVTKPRNSLTGCGGDRSDVGEAAKTVSNSISALRQNHLITESQKSNKNFASTGIKFLDNENYTQNEVVNGKSTGKTVTNLPESENFTPPGIKTVEENNAQKKKIVEAIVVAKCTDTRQKEVSVIDSNFVQPSEISYENISDTGCEASARTDATIKIDKVLEESEEVFEKTEQSIKQNTPANCKEIVTNTSDEADNGAALVGVIGGVSATTAMVEGNSHQQPGGLSQSQCQLTQEELNTGRTKTQTAVSSNTTSAKTFNLTTVIDSIKKAISETINNSINSALNSLVDKIQKLVSNISNSYISNVVSNLTGNIATEAQNSLQTITDKYVNKTIENI